MHFSWLARFSIKSANASSTSASKLPPFAPVEGTDGG